MQICLRVIDKQQAFVVYCTIFTMLSLGFDEIKSKVNAFILKVRVGMSCFDVDLTNFTVAEVSRLVRNF